MERAVVEERRLKAVAALDSRKRPFSALNDQASDNKRPKLDKDGNSAASASFLAAFDFTSLPAALITELIVANIEAFTEPTLVALVQAYRQSRLPELLAPVPTVPTAAAIPQNLFPETSSAAKYAAPPPSKLESVDPLQMDIDEELEYEPDKLNLEVRRAIKSFTGRA
jgi:symplekin